MQRIIRLDMTGALDVEMDMENYFNFLKEVKVRAEKRIGSLPEFQRKRISIEVTYSLGAKKKDGSVQGEVRIIEKEIQIDISNITKNIHDPESISEVLVDAAVEAVQRALSDIEASPESLPEPAKMAEKKKWWRFW